MRFLGRLIFPLMIFIITFATGGVYAVFSYQNEPPNDITVTNNIALSNFEFSPKEVLPGGSGGSGGDIGGSEVEVGQNHYNLIVAIIEHTKYGLNTTGNQPIIHNKLTYDGAVLYYEDNVQGGNLKKIFDSVTDNTEKVLFVIHRESATEYQIYTFLDSDLDKGVGARIETYKTLAKKKDGMWSTTSSYKGTAVINRPGIHTDYGIDVHTFIQS